MSHGNKHGPLMICLDALVCPNPNCAEVTLAARLSKAEGFGGTYYEDTDTSPLMEWQLAPESCAKPMPDYVPSAIVQDYQEACLIKAGSPKASATLSRRCLQGMIRDFWGVRKNSLYAEINAIEDEVDPDTWAAIDAVRSIGNIGAHMEKDINVIIDVEPDEADALISLIEILIKDWYVARYERQQRLAKIKAIADDKAARKKLPPPDTLSG